MSPETAAIYGCNKGNDVKRLIEKGLMFGNLVEVSSPVLVERYNRALRHLTGLTTDLSEFHIDISGYSPEVGDALGDDLYLNHAGVNRQFIMLTTDQKTAPLLNAKFSTSRGILRQFIEANEAALFALTARDAVAGELVNSIYSADTLPQLLNVRHIQVEADTTESTVASARKLGTMIDRFKQDDDAWYDDVLIAKMIGLAKRTGDVTRNPVRLRKMEFKQNNFWTSHFGGAYVFRALEHPAIILMQDKVKVNAVEYVFGADQRSEIAHFLKLNDLVEPIVKAPGIDAAAILRQKMDFIVVDVASMMSEDLIGSTRSDLRTLARKYHKVMPDAYTGLAQLLRWAEGDGAWPTINSDHPAYFYSLRAKDHPDADLVNMLLSELAPMDIRQMFIIHKEAFYKTYAAWPDSKKVYVADFLEREYQVDKAGAREALFGHDAPMSETPPATPMPPKRTRDIIDRVGPWGAVRRR